MDSKEILSLLSWILPPVLGAIIGFVTNAIAIKMLFRPLKEKRIFGLRVPMTPGIIPKQRGQLAQSIGNMVSKRLITPDAIQNHLNSPNFKTNLQPRIGEITKGILYQQVKDLDQEKLQIFYYSLERFLKSSLEKLFASEGFKKVVRELLDKILAGLSSMKVEKILANIKLKDFIISHLYPFITGEKMKGWLTGEISRWLDEQRMKNTRMNELMSEKTVSDLVQVFHSFLPELLDSLFSWLRSRELRSMLEIQGRGLLKNILAKLNLFQQFFISVGKYDKTLDEKIPEIIEDTLDSFEKGARDPYNQETFIQSVHDGILKWAEKGIQEVVGESASNFDEKIYNTVNQIFLTISDEKTREYIKKGLEDLTQSFKDQTIGEILTNRFQIETKEIGDNLYKYLTGYLEEAGTSRVITENVLKGIMKFAEGTREASIAQTFNITEETKMKIDSFLSDKGLDLLREKLPGVVESFNIKELVVNKINSLDIAEVEKLLLMVIAKHLKWINVFGAILGALIGFSQLVMKLLG